MPLRTRKPAASTCPPSLVSASSSNRSSRMPTAQIIAPAISTIRASWNTKGSAAREERQLVGHEVRRDQAAEHRQPAEVRDRLGVHVAVAHLRHGAGAQRDLAGDDRQAGTSRPPRPGRRGGTHAPGTPVLSPRRRSRSITVAPSGCSTSFSASTESAPARSSRGCEARTSRIVEASPLGDGPPSRTTSTLLAEHPLGLVGLGGGGQAAEVGRADGQRPGALEQRERDLVVGHPHRDRAPGLAQVPGQGRLLLADERERARPERLGERLDVRLDVRWPGRRAWSRR